MRNGEIGQIIISTCASNVEWSTGFVEVSRFSPQGGRMLSYWYNCHDYVYNRPEHHCLHWCAIGAESCCACIKGSTPEVKLYRGMNQNGLCSVCEDA